jgi:phosphoglycerol transferase
LVASLLQAAIADVEHLFMRYYNFVFPLLLVIAVSLLSLEQTTNMLKRRAIAAFPIGGAILYAVYTFLVAFTPNFIDCPELNGFTSSPIVFYVLSGISLVALALWVYSARAGAKIFVYLFLPLAVGFSTYYVNHELRQHLVPDVFDKAGIFVKQFLPNEERSKLVVAGSEPGGFFRSLFYIDNPKASWERLPEGAAYDLSKLPAGKEWILVIGDHPLHGNTFYQLQMNGFTLARATGTNTIDFREFSWPGIISSSYGLSSAEPFGRWSSGDVVTLEFCQPLPEKFAVHIIAHAFGPNIGKEFVARVADSGVRFTLGASSEERVLEFSNPKRSNIIKIDIPSPCEPKESGLSGGDERRLGIGFRELRIEPL